MKYYAVKVGRKIGIFNTWNECQKLVIGYPGAVYKSFATEKEAHDFLYNNNTLKNDIKKLNSDIKANEIVIAYVDGSYFDDIKRYSYGCVLFYQEKKYTLSGSDNAPDYVTMRNVAGEIMGCITAISWALEHKAKKIKIYYDYEGIEKWALGIWKANKKGTIKYKEYISQVINDIEISFVKVAAHTGVEYNEEADMLAKSELGLT